MNVAVTRAEHIDPALQAAGRGVVEGNRIRRASSEVLPGDGCMFIAGNQHEGMIEIFPTSEHSLKVDKDIFAGGRQE